MDVSLVLGVGGGWVRWAPEIRALRQELEGVRRAERAHEARETSWTPARDRSLGAARRPSDLAHPRTHSRAHGGDDNGLRGGEPGDPEKLDPRRLRAVYAGGPGRAAPDRRDTERVTEGLTTPRSVGPWRVGGRRAVRESGRRSRPTRPGSKTESPPSIRNRHGLRSPRIVRPPAIARLEGARGAHDSQNRWPRWARGGRSGS